MARKKIKLQWIADNGARKATYKKRVKSLLKKVQELSVLCGVDAAVIAYSRYHLEPEIWPSPAEIQKVVAAFRRRPEPDHTKKVVLNQEIFTSQRILKAKDELAKEKKKNRKKEMENLKTQCLAGDGMPLMSESLRHRDLVDLRSAVDNHLEKVKNMIDNLVPWLQAAAADGAGSVYNTGSHMGDINTVGAFTNISDIFSTAAAAHAHAPAHAHDETANAGGKTSFDLNIDDLNNHPQLTEQNQNQNISNALMEDPSVSDVSDFWLNPYLL